MPAMSGRAYVTLVTNADYLPGATALVRSLVRTGTTAEILVMHTGGVEAGALAPLVALGARLVASTERTRVEVLDALADGRRDRTR